MSLYPLYQSYLSSLSILSLLAFTYFCQAARAKRDLVRGIPISQVAIATGFADQSHFNRHFKRIVGTTPKQYALGCKNVQDSLCPYPLS